MASSRAVARDGRAGWTLMTAIHDALRRDLDQLLRATAGHTPARARWIMFAGQLRFHLAAEAAAMWSPAGRHGAPACLATPICSFPSPPRVRRFCK
jgi:hypothetical protein